MLALLWRLLAILFGYGVAVLAASLFLYLLALPALGILFAGLPPEAATGSFFLVPVVALFVSYFAFLPGMAAILVGEILGRSGWLFHALAGGGVALAVIVVLAQDPARDGAGDPGLLMAAIAAGMVGGIAYWAVAGRRAGKWRRLADSQGEP